MAAKEYSQWNALGRPVTPAQPIRELVAKYKTAFPKGKFFGWGANEEHYTANPPQDHTPFSYDGWPLVSPHWFVFATDIMVSDVGQSTMQAIVDYMLREARAGRLPWLKYIIWQAKIYDVRHGWVAQLSSGHYDHAHFSVRTDAQFTSLGDWSILPPPPAPPQEEDMELAGMDKASNENAEHYLQSIIGMDDTAKNISNVAHGDLVVPNEFVRTVRAIEADVQAIKEAVAALTIVANASHTHSVPLGDVQTGSPE